MSEVRIPSIEELLEAGVHFGHTTSRWHPKMEKFLFGKRGEIHIIDLKKTLDQLKEVIEFITQILKAKKQLLFVGVKPIARSVVKAEAERSLSPYIVNRWIGGTLTNWQAISSMLKRIKKYEDDESSGRLAKYTKHEQLEFKEDYDKLISDIGGIRSMKGKPGAVFIVDPKHDKTAFAEAKKLSIPVIAISDSNTDPRNIDYPIPGNDDGLKSISIITRLMADIVCEVKKQEEQEKVNNK